MASTSIVAALVALGASVALHGAPIAPQGSGAKTAADGVYTDEQSARGQTLASNMCASCHGDKLEGTESAPPLQGADFLTNWNNKTAGDLSEKIQMTMPADAVGTLTAKQSVDLIAYLFKTNAFPSGTMELPADSAVLSQIVIRPK